MVESQVILLVSALNAILLVSALNVILSAGVCFECHSADVCFECHSAGVCFECRCSAGIVATAFCSFFGLAVDDQQKKTIIFCHK